jgi:FkbM family methyltransferase
MNLIVDIKLFLKKVLPSWAVQYVRKYRYVKAVGRMNIREQAVIRRLVGSGDVVLDLGANYGWYTAFLATLVEANGHVYSVEPVPSTFRILKYIIKKLQLKNVSLFQYAISDRNETVRMSIPRNEGGGHNFYLASIRSDAKSNGARNITVQSRTLDDLFSDNFRKISFIKCDIEGHELHCLHGAAKIIETSHPVWYIEIMGDPDDPSSDAYKVFEIFRKSGYISFIYDGEKLHERKYGEKKVDYFFLQRSHIEQIKSDKSLKLF